MKIKLIPFNASHLEDSRKWMNNKQISRLFCRPYKVITPQAQKKWYANFKQDKTHLILAIQVDGVYVGNIGLKNIDLINKKAEYYIFIGNKDYWGKGIGKQATQQLLSYITKNLKLHKIYLVVDKTNQAAIRLYHKIGFVEEGVLKDELFYSNKYLTMIRMAYFLK